MQEASKKKTNILFPYCGFMWHLPTVTCPWEMCACGSTLTCPMRRPIWKVPALAKLVSLSCRLSSAATTRPMAHVSQCTPLACRSLVCGAVVGLGAGAREGSGRPGSSCTSTQHCHQSLLGQGRKRQYFHCLEVNNP